jgi:starch synthase
VRDLPRALSGEGWHVSVATPSYGVLHTASGAERIATLPVPFRDTQVEVEVWRAVGEAGVEHIILHHALFEAQGPGNKFAFFCIAAACWIRSLEQAPDVVHLHDWHAAFYLPVTHYLQEFESLRHIRTVFTIHNLAYQGTRPLHGDESSLAAWYPGMSAETRQIADPEQAHCINPMAAAIRLADRVSTVSPTYAGEICRPSDPDNGFNRLAGVLNGCFYDDLRGRRPGWQRIISMLESQLRDWL